MKNPLVYTRAKPPDTAGACVEARHAQALSYHRSPGGPRFQHQPARGQDPATAARRSVYDDATRHTQYWSQYDTARPTTSGLHPFLEARETPSKRYPASDRLPVRDPLPDG